MNGFGAARARGGGVASTSPPGGGAGDPGMQRSALQSAFFFFEIVRDGGKCLIVSLIRITCRH